MGAVVRRRWNRALGRTGGPDQAWGGHREDQGTQSLRCAEEVK